MESFSLSFSMLSFSPREAKGLSVACCLMEGPEDQRRRESMQETDAQQKGNSCPDNDREKRYKVISAICSYTQRRLLTCSERKGKSDWQK